MQRMDEINSEVYFILYAQSRILSFRHVSHIKIMMIFCILFGTKSLNLACILHSQCTSAQTSHILGVQ